MDFAPCPLWCDVAFVAGRAVRVGLSGFALMGALVFLALDFSVFFDFAIVFLVCLKLLRECGPYCTKYHVVCMLFNN
jgi:hypothetical protein